MTAIAPVIPRPRIMNDGLPPAALEVQDVSDLMRSVVEVTERLQTTHDALRAQIAALQEELAAANEKLRRSRSLAALGEMAAGIAHEVRNPLASILLDSQLLQEDLSARPEQAAMCARIRGAVQRLDTIVGDVLSFARDAKIHRELIDAEMLLKRSLESCEGVFRGSDIELVVKEPDARWAILGDESLLIQALGNVIRNAVEALMEHACRPRRIELSAARRRRRLADGRIAQRIVLAVTDTGPGMAAEVISRIFNPFFTTRRAGTGLGLAIVHRIVDAHRGEIDVASAPGQGTTISLCLPAAPATAEEHHESIQDIQLARARPPAALLRRRIKEGAIA